MNGNDRRFDDILKRKVYSCAYKKLPHEMKLGFGLLHAQFDEICKRHDWDSPEMAEVRDQVIKTAHCYVWTGVTLRDRIKLVRENNLILNDLKEKNGIV